MLNLCDSLAYDPAATDTDNDHAVEDMAHEITNCMRPHYVSNLTCPILRWVARFMHEVADTGKLNALGCAGTGTGATKAKTMIVTVVTRSVAQETCTFHHAHFVRARKDPSEPHQWYLLGPVDCAANLLKIDTKESFHLLVSYQLQALALRVNLTATLGACGYVWARLGRMDFDLSCLLAALAQRFPDAEVKDPQFVDAGFIAWLMDWQSSRQHAMPDNQFKSHLGKFARMAPELRDDFAAFVDLGAQLDYHTLQTDYPATVVHPSGLNNLPRSLQPLANLANRARQVRWWPWLPWITDGPIPLYCWSIASVEHRLVIHATEFSEFKQFAIQADQRTQDRNGCVYEKPLVWSNMNIDGDGLPREPLLPLHAPLQSLVVDPGGDFLLCFSTPDQVSDIKLVWLELPLACQLFWVPIAELGREVNAMGSFKASAASCFKFFRPASVRMPGRALVAAAGMIEDTRQYSRSSKMLTDIANKSLPSRLFVDVFLELDPKDSESDWNVWRGSQQQVDLSSQEEASGVALFHLLLRQKELRQHHKFERKRADERRNLELMRARIDRVIEQDQREKREAARQMYERLVQRLSKRTVEAAIANLPVLQEARDRMARIRGLQKPQPAESAAERAARQRWLREEAVMDKQVKEASKLAGREAAKVQADMAAADMAAARRRHKGTLNAARRERRAVRAAVRLAEVVEEQRIVRERDAMRAWHKEQEQAVRRHRRIAKAQAAAQRREAEDIDREARCAQKKALRQQRRAFRRLERGEPAEPAEPAEPPVDDASNGSGDSDDGDELPPLPAHWYLGISPPQEPQPKLEAPPSPATSTASSSYPLTPLRVHECTICYDDDPHWARLDCAHGHMLCMTCAKKLTEELADCPTCGEAIKGPPLACYF